MNRMSFVIYLTADVLVESYFGEEDKVQKPKGTPVGERARCVKLFSSERGAKISCATVNKKALKSHKDKKRTVVRYKQKNPAVYAVMSFDEWTEKFNPMVERKNMMSGKTYMERLYTESYMSPSCESYWSM
jgi:hypothetical protein